MVAYNLQVLILAGGSGTRLWPLSREEMPKQFLTLFSNRSLLQDTLSRMLRMAPAEALTVVTGEEWKALVAHQGRDVCSLAPEQVVVEPIPRNTCPAIALGAVSLLETKRASEEDLLFVAPSDHIVVDGAAFSAAVELAASAAMRGDLVLFGVPPLYGETGYGYVEATECAGTSPGGALPVRRFVEKPSREKAEEYVASGNFYWNSGMFCFRIGEFLHALEDYIPEIGLPARKGVAALLEAFPRLPSLSVDYAVMEKARNVAMVPLRAGWSDVGSWDAVYDVLPKDDSGNVVLGDCVLDDASGNLVFAADHLVALQGVRDSIVVSTSDAVAVLPRGASQGIRNIVAALRGKGRKEVSQTPNSVRPWGSYHILDESERYKIKRIVIAPGKRLSLQYHLHRSEHWIVVRGTAWVRIGDTDRFVHEGESIFVPKGSIHRLGNQGKIPLELIEVQCGEYVGEDDIVRVADDFRRGPGKENGQREG